MMSSLFQKVTYMLNQLFQAVMNPPLFVMKKNIFSFVVLLTKQINTLKLVHPFTADDKSPARVYFFSLSRCKKKSSDRSVTSLQPTEEKNLDECDSTPYVIFITASCFLVLRNPFDLRYICIISLIHERKSLVQSQKKSNIQDDVIQWVSYKNKTGPQHLRTPQRTECQQMEELHGSSDITR